MKKKKTSDLDIIKYARQIINKGWCKHSAAVDKNGNSVEVDSKSAVKWCSLGAFWNSCDHYGLKKFRLAISLSDILRLSGSVSKWNDRKDTTKAKVLRRFDEAIRRLEKGEAA